MEISSRDITAKSRKLKTNWTMTAQQGLSRTQIVSRVVVNGIHGILDGNIVDPEVPGADILIEFRDNWICKGGIYNPADDTFINLLEQDGMSLTDEEKDIIRGRLSDITGLVPVEPIKAEDVDFDWMDQIANEIKQEEDQRVIEEVSRTHNLLQLLDDVPIQKKQMDAQ